MERLKTLFVFFTPQLKSEGCTLTLFLCPPPVIHKIMHSLSKFHMSV